MREVQCGQICMTVKKVTLSLISGQLKPQQHLPLNNKFRLKTNRANTTIKRPSTRKADEEKAKSCAYK